MALLPRLGLDTRPRLNESTQVSEDLRIMRLSIGTSSRCLTIAIFVMLMNVGIASVGYGAESEFARVATLYVSSNIGVGLDMGAEDEGEDFVAGGVNFDIDPSVAVDLRYGTRIASHVAWEWQLEYAPEFEATCACIDESASEIKTKYSVFSFGINSKIFATTSRIQPYGLFGLGFTMINIKNGPDDIGPSIRGGGGVAYHINEHWSMNSEVTYVYPLLAVEDLDYLSVGVGIQYQF